MIPHTYHFATLNHEKSACCIAGFYQLTGEEASFIRILVDGFIQSAQDTLYIDAKEVREADLSGINEIIHSHYRLQMATKRLVLVYRKETSLEKWVQTTRLDHFIDTALIPAT